ncbi:MAG TPA: PadR family transcriptional regulator [Galbitalea sp.]|jgi:DNA-binding PadR family transcriptional regulator|nr:PadR family transcriptional regulator [Galbitalea sp.]
MSDSFFGGGFPGKRGGAGDNWAASAWETMEQLRDQFDRKVGMRMGRGDVRAAVLALLAEQPMHGYQIIHEIEERSGGSWKPSPGSVYPTLQLLADEDLIESKESNGRKTYSLTAAGKKEAEAAAASAPWASQGGREGIRTGALPKAGINLAQATSQVARTGNEKQVKEAVEILDDARRKIYGILAKE